MSAAERFLDTKVLLYLLSRDNRKADRAEEVVAAGGILSVQVLNEFASVASRKLRIVDGGNSRDARGRPRRLQDCAP